MGVNNNKSKARNRKTQERKMSVERLNALQTATKSTREAIIYGYEHYMCKKCKKIEKVYCETGIESVEGKPSPYEIRCDECGGVMVEMDYCHMMPKKRITSGEKYFANLPEKEVGTLMIKA